MTTVISFLLGMLFGGWIGFVVAAVLAAGGDE